MSSEGTSTINGGRMGRRPLRTGDRVELGPGADLVAAAVDMPRLDPSARHEQAELNGIRPDDGFNTADVSVKK